MDQQFAGLPGRTTNSGATWTVERPSNTDWFTMTFLDADTVAAGNWGPDDVPGSIWKRTGRSANYYRPKPSLLTWWDQAVWQARLQLHQHTQSMHNK